MKLRLVKLFSFIVLPCLAMAQGFVYPVGSPNQPPTHAFPNANGYKITQDFMNDLGHTGVDLANGASGGGVRSVGPGVVSLRLDATDSYGFGNVVLIRHDLADGTFYSLYAHLQDGSVLVNEGDQVKAGDAIAAVDNTGTSSGPHLHFAIKRQNALGCGYITPLTCTSGDTFDDYLEPLQFVQAHALGVIYNNGSPSHSANGGPDISITITADEFTLATGATITSVRFWSFEIPYSTFSGLISWTIYSDGGGVPGTILASGTASSVTRVLTGTIPSGIPGFSYNEFENDLSVGQVPLAAGTYWLGLHNGPANSISTTRSFYWEATNSSVSTVPSRITLLPYPPFWNGSSPWVYTDPSLAFALTGTVP